MIVLSGTLTINTKGVMTLLCQVGRFMINDARLHDVAAGKHPGFFEILKIEPYLSNGSQSQLQLAVRAVIGKYALQATVQQDMTTLAVIPQSRQLSLLDEGELKIDAPAVSMVAPAAVAETTSALTDVFVMELPVLKGTTVPTETDAEAYTSDRVELDPTLSRDQLRREIEHLSACGYRFNKAEQAWRRSA